MDPVIDKINPLTHLKWLNLYEAVYHKGDITGKRWFFASRKKMAYQTPEGKSKPDAVIIVPFLKNEKGEWQVVLVEQHRIPIFSREIDFPAGLIDANETIEEAATRELKEETGLDVKDIWKISPIAYSSAGLTDESIVYVFVEATGTISNKNQDKDEDIEVLAVGYEDICCLIDEQSNKKIGAKTYPILFSIIYVSIMKEINENLAP